MACTELDEAPPPPPVAHAHHPPPPALLALYKQYAKADIAALEDDPYILDLDNISDYHASRLMKTGELSKEALETAFGSFVGGPEDARGDEESSSRDGRFNVYTHANVPGLKILPSLPSKVQRKMLDCLLLRDLHDSKHKTNLHAHYALSYPKLDSLDGGERTFFDLPMSTTLHPLDETIHKPLSLKQALEKKLRWVTLGGQYDWTKKIYPEMNEDPESTDMDRREDVPPFPADLKALISSLFPQMTPEAAISNFYSPGDKLSPHRDVSEKSNKGLVSISIGCDALFLIGFAPTTSSDGKTDKEREAECGDHILLVRLKSGDVVVMDKQSRWAWHAVPKVIAGTSPHWLDDWPNGTGAGRRAWEGWMKRKRVNLNVRQMWD